MQSNLLGAVRIPRSQTFAAAARGFSAARAVGISLVGLSLVGTCGCFLATDEESTPPSGGTSSGTSGSTPPPDPYGGYGYGPIQFVENPVSNRAVEPDQLDLTFVDTQGKSISLQQYRDQKHLVLVFTRGFSGRLCAYCTTQTSRLISNYAQIARHDAEVLVVYPGPREQIDEFLKASREQTGKPADPVPFPILLDPDFKAVDQLGIRGDLAAPSTYIIDKQGKVRFAYVGASPGERPSIAALLRELEAIQGARPADAAPAAEAPTSSGQ